LASARRLIPRSKFRAVMAILDPEHRIALHDTSLPSGAASPLQPEVEPACRTPTRSARQWESIFTGYRP